MYLKTLKIISKDYNIDQYPFNLKLFRGFESIDFTSPLTIIMGDNGSGKSTLINLLGEKIDAVKFKHKYSNTLSESLIKDASKHFKLSMTSHPKKRFLFQGEAFTHYLGQINDFKEDASISLEEIETDYENRSQYSKKLARMPHERNLYEVNNLYDKDLNKLSHGQSFLEFFSKRISNNGLFLIDEPEAALSMENQLVFLNILSNSIESNSQIIISTHSPIIAAYPGAQILEIRNDIINHVQYDDIRSISFLKSFLENRVGYLRYLKNIT